jgi:nicotinate-nucleotide adenylyltransferase
VGVLGGTFDPVHLGHLRLAEAVRRRLDLPRVLIVPAALPPHKPPQSLTPAHHRAAMLRLALAGASGLELCTIELDTGGVCFTIDTLRALAGRPIFIVGSDALLHLHTWRRHGDLLAGFDLAAADRADEGLERIEPRLAPEIRARLVKLPWRSEAGEIARLDPGAGGRVFHVPLAPSPIASSQIRGRVAAGESIAELVPADVARYIHRMGLYRQEVSR